MKRERVIEIGGAGAAGLSAAIVLARRGHAVRVFERSSTVGRRFHDDFQGLENWSVSCDAHEELKGFGIEPTWWHLPFERAELVDSSSRRTLVRSARPLVYCVRRGWQDPRSLDNALLSQAQACGVEVIFGHRVSPTTVRVFAGGPSGRPTAIARGCTFAVDHPDIVCQILSNDVSSNGYAYLVVAQGRATLGTVLLRQFPDARMYLRRAIQVVWRLYGIEVPREAEHWGGYACCALPDTCTRGTTMFSGEAAGMQDALFGFGIRSAMLSGVMAAVAIDESTSYEVAWRARLLPLMRASMVNRAVYERVGFAAQALCTLMRWVPDAQLALRRIYGESAIHRMAETLWLGRANSGSQAPGPANRSVRPQVEPDLERHWLDWL
jgi:flavin-dependent dehydrogenase